MPQAAITGRFHSHVVRRGIIMPRKRISRATSIGIAGENGRDAGLVRGESDMRFPGSIRTAGESCDKNAEVGKKV